MQALGLPAVLTGLSGKMKGGGICCLMSDVGVLTLQPCRISGNFFSSVVNYFIQFFSFVLVGVNIPPQATDWNVFEAALKWRQNPV